MLERERESVCVYVYICIVLIVAIPLPPPLPPPIPANTHLLFVTPTPFAADATAAAGGAFFPECPSAPFALASEGSASAGFAWPLPIIIGVHKNRWCEVGFKVIQSRF